MTALLPLGDVVALAITCVNEAVDIEMVIVARTKLSKRYSQFEEKTINLGTRKGRALFEVFRKLERGVRQVREVFPRHGVHPFVASPCRFPGIATSCY